MREKASRVEKSKDVCGMKLKDKLLGFRKKDAAEYSSVDVKRGYIIPKNKLVPVRLKKESVSLEWLEKEIVDLRNFISKTMDRIEDNHEAVSALSVVRDELNDSLVAGRQIAVKEARK